MTLLILMEFKFLTIFEIDLKEYSILKSNLTDSSY